MQFSVPVPVLTAIRLLNEAGFLAYPVGGCVRDTLLGTAPHDWDMCTSASPEEMHRVFEGYRTIDTGMRHGTVSVIMDGMQLEITTFRTDGQYLDGRHPENVTFSTHVEDDLKRRDFTVNAMALDTVNNRVIDLFGGVEDLKNKIIRCVGDAEERFTEDALRILRALRFSARLGFTIEEETASAMLKLRGRLSLVSRERVAQELNGFLLSDGTEEKLLSMQAVFFAAIPALAPMSRCEQNNPYHDRDVWAHTALAVSCGTKDLVTRWTLLLHDCGKPACRTTDAQGVDHFKGHEKAGAEMAGEILEGLKMPRRLIEDVCCLITYHDIIITNENIWPLLATLGEERFFRLLDVRKADLAAHAAWVRPRTEGMEHFRLAARELLLSGACMSLRDLSVKGSDLAREGITGPAIGHTLNAMLRAITHRLCPNEHEALMTLLKEDRLPREEGLL